MAHAEQAMKALFAEIGISVVAVLCTASAATHPRTAAQAASPDHASRPLKYPFKGHRQPL
ncbi:hypothetical protein LTR37_015106 [Vermiconidia calcicola]|uniref:Uncharacterized protein n=1 Tax=Vermiconidia calcicola TaxID=1690605 RepID=A0ACC3MRL1_9PEZI|nr:hypothetical protein LTR37_015106 [Vermiconidia calcicola]